MKARYFTFIVLILAFSTGALAEESKVLNNGQDLTRPLARFDTRYQYQLLKNGRSKNTFTARTDRPFVINERWQVATRVDLPLVLSNKVTADEPNGALKGGLGDVLSEIDLIRTFNELWAAGAGTQFIFPTAGNDQMGDGKYQLLPTLGVRRQLPAVSNGSFAGFTMRYAVDYAGSRKRPSISTLEMAPTFNWVVRDNWFLTTYPSNDIQINFQKGGAVFLPFDIMIGKTIPRKAVFSVELGFPMYHHGNVADFYTSYDLKMEARVGVFY
jgi:hypothetical protein